MMSILNLFLSLFIDSFQQLKKDFTAQKFLTKNKLVQKRRKK